MGDEEASSLEARYRQMSEPELMELAREYDDLTESAQSALRSEFQRRSLEPPLLDEPAVENTDPGALVAIERYRDLAEAFVARSVLESAGIPCFLCDENFVRLDWAYSNFIGGMRLQVASKDADDAHELLTQKAPRNIDVPGEPTFVQPICPRCGSDDIIAYDPGLRTAAVGVLIGLPTRFSSHRTDGETWHCMNCGLNWSDSDEPENLAP
jgi:predicted RNA-binding Zn-ribbon protein involved in translation (DUF1610 family)